MCNFSSHFAFHPTNHWYFHMLSLPQHHILKPRCFFPHSSRNPFICLPLSPPMPRIHHPIPWLFVLTHSQKILHMTRMRICSVLLKAANWKSGMTHCTKGKANLAWKEREGPSQRQDGCQNILTKANWTWTDGTKMPNWPEGLTKEDDFVTRE